MIARRLAWIAGWTLVAVGCGGDDDGVVLDAGTDAWVESDTDAGHDAGRSEERDGGAEDAGRDASRDAGSDAGIDASDVCSASRDVTAGGIFEDETTVGAGEDHAQTGSGCPTGGNASGPDVTYLLAPTVATAYEIAVTPREGSSFDPMLYVLAQCDSATCIDGTRLNGPGERESLSLALDAGERVFLVVDGQSFSSGAYTLEVTIPE